jgi:type IV pilus assembly protein PilX
VRARGRCGAVPPERARQRGAALVCSLVLMLATMLVAVSISRAVFASIASAGAERERSLAYETAEAALRDAERDIAAGADPARAAQFGAAGAGGFVDGCGRGGVGRGLCGATSPPAWQALDLAEPGNPALVPYGYFTGASLGTGKGLLPARPPAYLIERIAPPGAGPSLGSFYRITAIGFGSNAATRVVLQSVYRKPKPAPPGGAPPGTGNPSEDAAPGGTGPPDGVGMPGWPGDQGPAAPDPPAPGQGAESGNGGNGNGGGNGSANKAATQPAQLPAGRIGWREIANWARLHAEAEK